MKKYISFLLTFLVLLQLIGCGGSGGGGSQQVNHVNLTADKKVGLFPLTVTFTATPNNSNDVPPYTWDFGDGTPEVQGGKVITHTYEKAGHFSVKVDVPSKNGHTITGSTVINAWGVKDTYVDGGDTRAVYCGSNKTIYVADGTKVHVLNGSDPYNLSLYNDITGLTNAINLTKDGPLIVIDGKTIRKFSIEDFNPQTYTQVAQSAVMTDSDCTAVYYKNYYCYVVGSDSVGGFLRIFNSILEQKKTIGLPGIGKDVLGKDNLLFIAGTAGLYVYDITDPENPKFLEPHPTGIDEEACGLFLKDNYLYMTTKKRLMIYEINPINENDPLIYKGSINIPGGEAYKVYVSQKYAFVAAGSKGIQIVNVSNPRSPQIIGEVPVPGTAYSIWVSYMDAYVCAGTAGLHSVCVAPPWPDYY